MQFFSTSRNNSNEVEMDGQEALASDVVALLCPGRSPKLRWYNFSSCDWSLKCSPLSNASISQYVIKE